MLVNPAGGAVVLMHSPKNQLEFVDVTRTNDALAAGYVPLRTAEISELITGLNEEVIRLRAENERLRQVQARVDMQPSYRSQAVAPTVDLAAQAAAERAQRRQQLLQAWIMLQNMNRSQTINLNVTDCTRAPCAR
jgi:DNA repair exonuclease SbcCD ATPase subunit